MNLFTLSGQNLKARPLNTFMSLLLLTLGVSIISMLLLLNQQLEDNFNRNIRGIDLVVGAKGSPLQLILASVYHIDNPTGNIPLSEARSLMKHPLVEKAIPQAYGDSYQGYRILGTDTSYVGHYAAEVAEGRLWERSFEVTLGARVAQLLGLHIGDEFYGQHGSNENAAEHDEHAYRVVGILAPSGSVVDQLILTDLRSVWEVHAHKGEEKKGEAAAPDHADHDHAEHEDHAHEALAEEDRDITSLLIKFRSSMGIMVLPRMINEQTSMQAALPAFEVNRLLGLFDVGIQGLRAIALAIIVISGISVFVSLYNSLKERRYELALMRSMGASRGQLLLLLVLEGVLLALLGGLLGLLLSRGGMWLLSSAVVEDFHYQLSLGNFLVEEIYLLGGALLTGLLAASLPAVRAFNLDISETLAEGG